MLRLGITGGIGSGKSTVSELLIILGIPVYIADIESKKLTESSPIIRSKLIETFGEELYSENKLNKKKLASIIFNDNIMLKKVNSIIHPEVDKHYTEWCYLHKKSPLIGLESAILFESKMVRMTDQSLLVYSSLEDRIRRTMARDNVSRDLVLSRINSQMSDEIKLTQVDHVIYNDEKSFLINQVEHLLTKLTRKTNG